MSQMKQLVLGILAHVDSGKTTLSEAMMYSTGAIRKLGRVDHGDTHLDTDEIEQRRGITVFSSQARFTVGNTAFTILDTPGHVDFSPEAERVLQVLDYAILVISAGDGVQAHTETLWKLLKRYNIPTFLFINKIDLPWCGKRELLRQLQEKLSPDILDLSDPAFVEDAAVRDVSAMDAFLNNGELSDTEIGSLVERKLIFPCCFGSALKLDGVDTLLSALDRYTLQKPALPEFSAKVYKIMRDERGERLTCMKITGGKLTVRDSLTYYTPGGEEVTEKVTGIRLYTGNKYSTAQEVTSGGVCCISGLQSSRSGMGMGGEQNSESPILDPYMSYTLRLPAGSDAVAVLAKMRQLEEEEPALHVEWDQKNRQIRVRLMGNVQIEVLKDLIRRKFDLSIDIDDGAILYRETIANTVEGVGHFEPLRHYAEVHLLLKPLSPGDGLHFTTHCDTDALDLNWQRLILTHLAERSHLGILTGAPITDMEICLMSGKAHLKHTEGGDFRQATYRAVRQGLMQAKSVLLEPMMTFRLEVPAESIGRAIQDLHQRHADQSPPEILDDGSARISGTAPVVTLRGYDMELSAYTRGRGRFSCYVSHYAPCHNTDEVMAAFHYRPEEDLENTPDSVFCSHGAGTVIKWNKVPEYMHLPSVLKPVVPVRQQIAAQRPKSIDDKELEAIMEREFGPISRKKYSAAAASPSEWLAPKVQSAEKLLLLDGYNLIFAWPGLQELALSDLNNARDRLMDIISNYCGFTGCKAILIFDAYKVKGGMEKHEQYKNISVVYTEEGETCDLYIEKVCHDLSRNYRVSVVTSDGLIQLAAFRFGINRISSREFIEDVARAGKQMLQHMESSHG